MPGRHFFTESFIASTSAAKEDQFLTVGSRNAAQSCSFKETFHFFCVVRLSIVNVWRRFCGCKVRIVDHEVKSQGKQNGRSCHTSVAMDTFLRGVLTLLVGI